MSLNRNIRVPERVQAKIDRQCPSSKKESFHGRKQALSYASWSNKTYGTTSGPYKCPYCNSWHITTISK